MKKIISCSFISLLLGTFSFSAIAEPYTTFYGKEKEVNFPSDIKIYKFEELDLPFQNVADEYFNGKNKEMQLKMGIIFEKGLFGAPVNANEAAKWYNQAALNGSTDAALKLYSYSKQLNKNKVDEIAYDWLNFAASKGDANALYELGNYYSENMSTQNTSNLNLALKNYKTLVNQNYPNALSKYNEVKKEIDVRNKKE